MTVRSHIRRNPLTGEDVLVSPDRTQRPWRGQLETAEADDLPDYDADCYLCPGNERAGDARNPDYRGTFCFDNDFPALTDAGNGDETGDDLLRSRDESGFCRVLCYTKRHGRRLATMTDEEVTAALQAMTDEFCRLDADPAIGYVQIFENRGEMMGCSNPHPHAQIWATAYMPNEPARELQRQQEYFRRHGSNLLLDYLQTELDRRERLVTVNDDFVAIVPYWAVWPFETLLLPRREVAGPDAMTPAEHRSLAGLIRAVLQGCERLFRAPVPYSLGFHPRPSDGMPHEEWLFHAHVCPPLLRSASVRKHMVGFEMFGMPQRDLTPEQAAAALREHVT